MYIFAWILWGIYVFIFFLQFAQVLGCCMAMNDPTKNVKIEVDIFKTLLNIAVFIFLNFYLFS